MRRSEKYTEMARRRLELAKRLDRFVAPVPGVDIMLKAFADFLELEADSCAAWAEECREGEDREDRRCLVCNGHTFVFADVETAVGPVILPQRCPECDGEGYREG